MYVGVVCCIKTVDFTVHAVSDLCALQRLSLCAHRCRLRDFRSRVFPGAEKKREMRAGTDHRGRERLSTGGFFPDPRIFHRARLTTDPRLTFMKILIVR